MAICTIGKINTFDSIWNFIILQWQKNCSFLSTFFFPSSLRERKINDDLQQYDTNPTFSNFFFSKIFFILIFITCHQKELERPRFGGSDVLRHFTKSVGLAAKFDSNNWHYAIDEYCNFVIVVKSGFFSEKNHSWCHWIFVKTLEKLP